MSILLYRLFLWLYRLGAMLISPFNIKAKRWLSGRKNVFNNLATYTRLEQRPITWFHCASLGEFEQARPLLEAIRKQYPENAILLSFFSPSGYEIRKNYTEADYVTYMPMDSQSNATAFLELVKPRLVIWVKYEYWHFYLKAIKQRNISLLLISGIFRPGQPFFRRWGNFHRQMLTCFSWMFVQNQESKKLLGSIGLSSNVSVSGDTRFDRVAAIAASVENIALIDSFINGDALIVAGSTWEEDEEELDHFANTHPEIKFIIAPHEIDEEHLRVIEKLFHHSVRYSQLGAIIQNSKLKTQNVLIIDNIGMLSRLYKYATIAYVGGGFGNDGVHNVLEAAVYGVPVIFGPVFEKFIEAAELVDAGAAFDIDNALELEEMLQVLLKQEEVYMAACKAGAEYVTSNTGATGKILHYIQENRLLTS